MNTQNPNTYYEPKTIQPTGKAIHTSNGWLAIHEVSKPRKDGCLPAVIVTILLVITSFVTIFTLI